MSGCQKKGLAAAEAFAARRSRRIRSFLKTFDLNNKSLSEIEEGPREIQLLQGDEYLFQDSLSLLRTPLLPYAPVFSSLLFSLLSPSNCYQYFLFTSSFFVSPFVARRFAVSTIFPQAICVIYITRSTHRWRNGIPCTQCASNVSLYRPLLSFSSLAV